MLNQKTGRAPAPLPNYCGHCTRCLKACPTEALQKSTGLNSNQCISYWTLEKRGELRISLDQKRKIGPWVAGCDICQEVCPFNKKPTQVALREEPPAPSTSATALSEWHQLLVENSESYKKRVKNSALKRVKPQQFSRNLAISLANCLEAASPSERQSMVQTLKPLIQLRIDSEDDTVAQAEWQRCLLIANNSPRELLG